MKQYNKPELNRILQTTNSCKGPSYRGYLINKVWLEAPSLSEAIERYRGWAQQQARHITTDNTDGYTQVLIEL